MLRTRETSETRFPVKYPRIIFGGYPPLLRDLVATVCDIELVTLAV